MLLLAVGPGHYPTGMPRKPGPGGLEPWEEETAYPEALGPEAIARASARNKNKKSNHFGQVVPIYGVGILLYILHIFVKVLYLDDAVISLKFMATLPFVSCCKAEVHDDIFICQERSGYTLLIPEESAVV